MLIPAKRSSALILTWRLATGVVGGTVALLSPAWADGCSRWRCR